MINEHHNNYNIRREVERIGLCGESKETYVYISCRRQVWTVVKGNYKCRIYSYDVVRHKHFICSTEILLPSIKGVISSVLSINLYYDREWKDD